MEYEDTTPAEYDIHELRRCITERIEERRKTVDFKDKFIVNYGSVDNWFTKTGFYWFRKSMPSILHDLGYDKSKKDDVELLQKIIRRILQDLPIPEDVLQDNMTYVQQQSAKYSKWWLENFRSYKVELDRVKHKIELLQAYLERGDLYCIDYFDSEDSLLLERLLEA